MQQSNCVSDYAAGLAAAIAEKFPYADVYQSSARPSASSSEQLSKGNRFHEAAL